MMNPLKDDAVANYNVYATFQNFEKSADAEDPRVSLSRTSDGGTPSG
jgi:hypothetical protein